MSKNFNTNNMQKFSFATPDSRNFPETEENAFQKPITGTNNFGRFSLVGRKTDLPPINEQSSYLSLSNIHDQQFPSLPDPSEKYIGRPREFSRKSTRQFTLQLNLDDAEMDEFSSGPPGPRTTNHQSSVGNKTPFLSSNIKTMSGLEIKSPRASLGTNQDYQVRNPIFPNGPYSEKARTSPGFIFPEMSPPKLKNQRASLMNSHNRKKEMLLDIKILGLITKFLGCEDLVNMKDLIHEYRHKKEYKKLFKERMFALIAKGLNGAEQYRFWNSLLKFRKIQEAHPFTFTSQFVKPCSYFKDIMKDLDRTFPEYDKYSTAEGKESLLRVLVAMSHTVKDVGYIQGLNSIAGVFLFYLNEEKTYWITLYMMEKLKVKNILREGFNSVHVLNYQLQVFMENYLPEMASFLKRGSAEMADLTTPWFITLFSYFLALPNIIKTWNFFFIKGNAFLVQVGLAVLSRYQNRILSMDVDEIGSFFKYDLKEVSEHDDGLFEEALRFHVPKRLMLELEDYYHKGKPNLKLKRDRFDKLQWEFPHKNSLNERPSLVYGLDLSPELKKGTSTSNKFDSPRVIGEKSKEIVQNIMNTIGELPGVFKSIFSKDFDTKRSTKICKTDPTEQTEPSYVFDSESPNTEGYHEYMRKESRLRSHTDHGHKEDLFKNSDSNLPTAETDRYEHNPNMMDKWDPYMLQSHTKVTPTSKASYGFSPNQSPNRLSATAKLSPSTYLKTSPSDGNFSFHPQPRLSHEPLASMNTVVQSKNPLDFDNR